MTNQLKRLFILTFFVGLLLKCHQESPKQSLIPPAYQSLTDSIRLVFTPDQRVDRFRPQLKLTAENCLQLSGVTTNEQALEALLFAFKGRDICVLDSMRRLPASDLGKDTLGIVNVSVANLRTQAKHSGELTTQVLMGMPLKVLDRQKDWFLVQSPEKYIAWLDAGAFVQTDAAGIQDFYGSNLAMVNQPLIRLTDRPAGGTAIRDLSTGGLVRLAERRGAAQRLILPDGQSGFLPATAVTELATIAERAQTLDVPTLARQFYGAPYLWGGTSAKGMDCSGFTKMTYLTNGYVIPRDASQQVHAGQEVPLDEELSQLQKGDLLFFGNLRQDGSQRITHVGIYLGGGRFVHSGADNGFVKEQNLLPSNPDFAAQRRESLLRAKRLAKGTEGVTPLLEVIEQYLSS